MLSPKKIKCRVVSFYKMHPHFKYLFLLTSIFTALVLKSLIQLSLYKGQEGYDLPYRRSDPSIHMQYTVKKEYYQDEALKRAVSEIGLNFQQQEDFNIKLVGGSSLFQNGITENGYQAGEEIMRQFSDVKISSSLVSDIKNINPKFDLDKLAHEVSSIELYTNRNGQPVLNGNDRLSINIIGSYIFGNKIETEAFKKKNPENFTKIAKQLVGPIFAMQLLAEDFLLKEELHNKISVSDKQIIKQDFF